MNDIVLRPAQANPADIVLRPVGGIVFEADGFTTFTVSVAGYAENAAPPVVPPKPSGPAGGMVYFREKGPVNRGRKSPWERAKTLEPTARRTKRVEVDPDADDLEVVEILTHWLGRL